MVSFGRDATIASRIEARRFHAGRVARRADLL